MHVVISSQIKKRFRKVYPLIRQANYKGFPFIQVGICLFLIS